MDGAGRHTFKGLSSPGLFWWEEASEEGVISSVTFLRRHLEKTRRKLLFSRAAESDSEEHEGRTFLSLTHIMPELQLPQLQMLPLSFLTFQMDATYPTPTAPEL